MKAEERERLALAVAATLEAGDTLEQAQTLLRATEVIRAWPVEDGPRFYPGPIYEQPGPIYEQKSPPLTLREDWGSSRICGPDGRPVQTLGDAWPDIAELGRAIAEPFRRLAARLRRR